MEIVCFIRGEHLGEHEAVNCAKIQETASPLPADVRGSVFIWSQSRGGGQVLKKSLRCFNVCKRLQTETLKLRCWGTCSMALIQQCTRGCVRKLSV